MLIGELPLRDFNIISLIRKRMTIPLGSVRVYIMCVVYSIKDRKTWNIGGKYWTGTELCTLNAILQYIRQLKCIAKFKWCDYISVNSTIDQNNLNAAAIRLDKNVWHNKTQRYDHINERILTIRGWMTVM